MKQHSLPRSSSWSVATLLATSLLIALGCSTNLDGGGTLSWHTDTVDASVGVGEYTSIALDSNDRPHISYRDYADENLKYTRWTGSAWDGQDAVLGVDAVDLAGNVGASTSIALDVNDRPHISYEDSTNGDLKYTRWTGTAWDGLDGTAGPDAVDTAGTVGSSTSIALDSFGYPHISYLDLTNLDLKYARWTGTTWDGLDGSAGPDSVDTAGSVGYDTSIALDGNNRPHIAYLDLTNGAGDAALKYARWNGTIWDGLDGTAGPDVVDTVGSVGYFTSIALDSSERPHISYYDTTNGNLKYVRWTGTTWDGQDGTAGPDVVDDAGDVGYYTSIEVDAGGYPQISYFDNTDGDLMFARWTGSAWDGLDHSAGPDVVDSAAIVGPYTSIALDSKGRPHISYRDLTNQNLKYAWYGE